MRRVFMSCLAAVALLWIPVSAPAQDMTQLFRKVSPSVVVIRAKGREVTATGQSRFNRDGIGRADLGRWQGHDGGPRRAHHGHDHRGVPGGRDGAGRVVASEPAADLSMLQLDRVPPGVVVAKLGNSDKVQVGAAGDRRRCPVRPELFHERGLDQRQLAAQHRLQVHATGRVLPNRRHHQHRELGRPNVRHGGRGDRPRQPQHLQERGQRRSRLRGDDQHRQAAPAHEEVVLERARRSAPLQRPGRPSESPLPARAATSSRRWPRARPPRRPGSTAARSSPPSTVSRSCWRRHHPERQRDVGGVHGRPRQDPRHAGHAQGGLALEVSFLRAGHVLEADGRLPEESRPGPLPAARRRPRGR